MNRALIFSAVLFVLVAFLSVIWIVFPAPSKYIWLYSVAVGEWSLWFAALAFAGIVCAAANYAFYKNGRVLVFALAFGSIAILLALYPLFSSLTVAREKNVELSLNQYFSGLTGSVEKSGTIETRDFARVGETVLQMDVYAPPSDVKRNGASVIVVHGGSWSGGVRSDFPQWNRWLAANGFVVFDIAYRLSPQPNYPAAIGDVKCAVKYVKNHAAELNIEPEKIVLLGRSAGAHLALIAAYSADDERLPASCGDAAEDETVRAVVAFYAPTDLLWDYDNPANQLVIDGPKTLADFLGGNPHSSEEIKARYEIASPSARVGQKTPPTLLIHGGKDQLVREENLDILAAKLKAAGISHETLILPYAQHGFDYNFNGWGSQIAQPPPVILDFLSKSLSNSQQ